MATLLIVHQAPTGSLRRLLEAALEGARHPDIEGVQVRDLEALAFARGEADAEDLLAADGYLLVTTANFGYMSGALKHMFDATFLRIGGALDDSGGAAGDSGAGDGELARPVGTGGRPYGLLVHGRYDTAGAIRSVEAIVGALGWRPVAQPASILGDVDDAATEAAYELGGTLAALLSA